MATPTSNPVASTAPRRGLFAQLARDVGYLLPTLPITVISFSVLWTLASAAGGLLVVWIGVPLAVATMWVAKGFAEFERLRLRGLGRRESKGEYRPAEPGTTWQRMWRPMSDSQMWRDAAHGVLAMPLAIFTWSVTITWVTMALGGTTAWIWSRFLPAETPSAQADIAILRWIDSSGGQFVLGMVALVSLPWVAKGMALAHVGLARLLLEPTRAQRLRADLDRLGKARRAAATAERASLRRVERDLHDGPQQRLIRLSMDVQAAERALEKDPEAARAALASAREQSVEALAELRALTRGIAPPLLAERGLCAAVESLAAVALVPVTVDCDVPDQLSLATETAAYFVVSEALANVAKHANARSATVRLEVSDGSLSVTVTDDGEGGAHVAKGSGLAGLADRVAGAGGTLTVADGEDGGTVVTAELPCA